MAGCGKPKSVTFSPRHDRVVFDNCQWGDSEAVFDSSGAVVYRIPFAVGSVAFTPGGDTLFLASFDTLPFSGPTLFAIDAATGHILGRADAPGAGYGYTGGVALDPAHPLLYVFAFDGRTAEYVIMVYDRAAMRRVATLRAGQSTYVPDLYIDPAGRRLYVVAKNNGNLTAVDLVP